jgi:hypothetical protein
MFGIWSAHKGRRAAVARIAPFVSQSYQRLGQIPEATWSTAYMIGFLGTLITLCAQRAVGELGISLLASVQTGAWSDITQTKSILLGEEIVFLSTTADKDFELACQNARFFFEALNSADSWQADSFDDAGDSLMPSQARQSCSALWIRYFDTHVAPGYFLDP